MKLHALVDKLSRFLLAQQTDTPFIFGVSGGQGAGKSTLCTALAKQLGAFDKKTVTLSLDDFYLSKAARADLAASVHPLCATRGVPGTHDVARLAAVLAALGDVTSATPLPLPRFSKSHDDCAADGALTYRPDFVLLEGWCVGAHADCISPMPQNEWERAHDPHAIWKGWSRAAASAYQPIFETCDALMLLRQENFDAVIDARWAQEQGNAAASGVWQFKDRAEVAAFCAHYESWTLGLWDDLARRADFVFGRDADYIYYPFQG